MTLGRRLLLGGRGVSPIGQAEWTVPGTYAFRVPAGVRYLEGVAIGGGIPGPNTSPFNGGWGANNHWRNRIPVTPGEWLIIKVANGNGLFADKESYVRRGATNLLFATNRNLGVPQHPTLGGGGGDGGSPGSGSPGNGGLGGGAAGYAGAGGKGGNYYDTTSGAFADTDSGGGRGGDANGVPTGWQSANGEGTGLLGRSADKTTSLGAVKCGWGGWAAGTGGGDGGVRLIWGGSRLYPDSVPDLAAAIEAAFISSANGNAVMPAAFTFHTDAQEGDLVLALPVFTSNGSLTGVTGSDNWGRAGGVFWKQVTQDDIDASQAGTVKFGGSGSIQWVTLVYRGANVAAMRSQGGSAGASSLTLAGFTKRLDCKRVVTIAHDTLSGSALTLPTGFTSRVSRTTPRRQRGADKPPSAYSNGEAVVWPGVDTDEGGGAVGYLIELF
ncbi:hypothetical protein LJR164_001640 [Phenylobacterium sp. LjRoot164]|uniref:hypothetical protein n=1 Tax=unclassified Phenylobacterium TaxID=2640670 RepID=UPI003ECEE64F